MTVLGARWEAPKPGTICVHGIGRGHTFVDLPRFDCGESGSTLRFLIPIALAVAGVLGGGLQNAIVALAAISWPKYARIARSQTLSQKETQWMKAVRLSGSGTGKIILKHILPNIIGPVLVTAMLDIGTMMMELAALSFLGLGAKPPIPEWGSMMSDTRSLMTTSPWITFSPGIAIFISVMIFNLLGDTIRDYADPKSRR